MRTYKLLAVFLFVLALLAINLRPALAQSSYGLNDWGTTVTCGGETLNFVFPPGGRNPILMILSNTQVMQEVGGTITATGFYLATQEWVTLTYEFRLGYVQDKAFGLQDRLETCMYRLEIPEGYFPGWSDVTNDVVVTVHRTPSKP
jgi:hypothetical protein